MHYRLASELSTYSRAPIPIVQFNESIRWVSFPKARITPDARGIYVVEDTRDLAGFPSNFFAQSRKIAEIDRSRGEQPIQKYFVYLVADANRKRCADPTLPRRNLIGHGLATWAGSI